MEKLCVTNTSHSSFSSNFRIYHCVINEEENVEMEDIFIALPPPNELTDKNNEGLLDNLPN